MAEPLFRLIPWDEVLDLADDLLEDRRDRDAVLDDLAWFLDSCLHLEGVAPPLGVALEALDRPVFRAALEVVVALASHPENRAARLARRAQRRAERDARREARRAERG